MYHKIQDLEEELKLFRMDFIVKYSKSEATMILVGTQIHSVCQQGS